LGRKAKPLGKKALLCTARNLLRPLTWMFSLTPWERADGLGRFVGAFAYALSRRYRRAAIANLLAAFPEMMETQARRIAKETFGNFCRAFIEFFIAGKLTPADIKRVVSLEGIEHADEALRRGKGGIILTAHIGNWELMGRRLVAQGYPLNVIARNSDDPTMTGIVNTIRERGGYKVLSRDESVRESMRRLRANEFLGILPDQNTLGKCVFVDFFGRPAATPAGAALFALKTGATILPTFNRYDRREKRYATTIYPPLEVSLTGDTDRDVETVTAACTALIEAEIRKDPAQWLWLHSRWKRTAEAPAPA